MSAKTKHSLTMIINFRFRCLVGSIFSDYDSMIIHETVSMLVMLISMVLLLSLASIEYAVTFSELRRVGTLNQ